MKAAVNEQQVLVNKRLEMKNAKCKKRVLFSILHFAFIQQYDFLNEKGM